MKLLLTGEENKPDTGDFAELSVIVVKIPQWQIML